LEGRENEHWKETRIFYKGGTSMNVIEGISYTKKHLDTWHECHQWNLLCTKKDSFVVHGFSVTLNEVSPRGQLNLSIVGHY
jgi:riboflavin synthase alpha subunit